MQFDVDDERSEWEVICYGNVFQDRMRRRFGVHSEKV